MLLFCLVTVPIAAVAEDPPDYMQPILMSDPTLNNSISLTPIWQHSSGYRELSLGWELDKALSAKSQIAIASSWATESTIGEGNRNGLTNSDLSLGYVFLTRPEFQAMVISSISLQNGLGISEPETVGLSGSAGGRMAMFNESVPVPIALQPIQFNFDMGSDIALGTGSNDVYANAQLAYSLPYLEFASKSKLPPVIRGLNPFVMISYNQPISGNSGSQPAFFVAPGMAFQGGPYQVGTALELPMNGTAHSSQQIGIAGSLIIYLDQIDSRFGKTLF